MKTARHKQGTAQRQVQTSVSKIASRSLDASLEKIERLLTSWPANDAVERTHQLRVASRRADVALRLFKHWLPRERRQTMQQMLRQAREEAGAVRDLDLLRERWSVSEVTAQKPAELVEWLQQRTESDHEARWIQLREWTRKSVRRRLQDRSRRLIELVRWQGDGKPPSLDDWILRALDKMIRQFEQFLLASGTNVLTCHRARIRGRRLRYALELLGDCLPAHDPSAVCLELTNLQELLGRINDDITAGRFLEAVSGECSDPTLKASLDQLLEETHALALSRLAEWNNSLAPYSRRLMDMLSQIVARPS